MTTRDDPEMVWTPYGWRQGPGASKAAQPNETTQAASQIGHTQGPWTAKDGLNGDFEIVAGDGRWNNLVLCSRSPWSSRAEESRANARLIAAAPEMLAALKAQHDALDILIATLVARDIGFRPSKSAAWPAVVQGNAAIKKAEGRS